MTDSRRSPALLRHRLADLALVVLAGGVDMAFWGGDHRDLTGSGRLPSWLVPVVAIGLCVALLFRHRFPVQVWLLAWLHTSANLVVPDYYPFTYLLIANYAVARRAPALTARIVLIASALPLGLFSYRSAQSAAPEPHIRDFLAAVVIWSIILSVAWGSGRVVHAREQHAIAERERLTAEAEKELIAQRLRLAHELHDSVTGAVAGMILHAGAARALCTGSDPRVEQALEVIEHAGAQAMTELHSMLGLLRSTEPPGAAPARFADAERLLESARHAGLRVRSEITGTPRPLDPGADLAAYRTVQESLTNATKHAGRGAEVTLSVAWTPATLDLTVRSSGGSAPSSAAALSAGTGLHGLRERLDALGGELTCGPEGDGWCVHASLPAVTGIP
ncbi:sensor histidine kinase [Nocardia sp. NPDC056000]|uniref:sensor histidine kinase n=1 Tax=Nocardia sp. NPDC056000 TaxID=3345674 RepID=UPI0035D7EC52